MTKKRFVGWVSLSVFFIMAACGGGKYSDAIKLNTKFADAMEEYIGNLEKADNAGAVAGAINDFATQMETLGPQMRKLSEKYPELKNKDQDHYPEALRECQKRSEELGLRMAGSFMKTMKYMNDSKVRAAQERLQKAMGSMMPS